MFAKVLIILIAISFIFIGTGGSLNNSTIATVDDTEINKSTVYTLYRNTISQPNFPKLSTKQQKSIGVVENILEQQINFISQYAKADELGISVSDKFMVNRLASIEQFQSLGRFDKMKFQQVLASNNLSVEQFTRDLRREEIANRYSLSFNKIKFPATNIKKLLTRNDNQTRDIITAKIKINSIPVKNITDKKLKDFYNNKKSIFNVPETRNVEILEISSDAVAKTITDKSAKDFFNKNKNIYEKPETRDFYLIPGEKDKLIKIKNQVKNGVKIATAVKDVLGLEYSDLLNKGKDKQSTQEAIKDAVWNGKVGKISEPVDMILNNVLVVVNKVSKKQSTSFAKIKQQIKSDMAKGQIFDLVTTAEDELAEGKDINEIAKSVNLKTTMAENVSTSGSFINPITTDPKVSEAIFQAELNEVSFPVEVSEHKFAIVSVNKINQSYIPKYDDITKKVKTAYISEQRNIELRKIINDMVKSKSQTEFKSKAKGFKMAIANKSNLKKSPKVNPLVFSTPKQKVNAYENSGQLIVFYVKKIKIPAKANKAKKSLLANSFDNFNENQNFFSAFKNIRSSQDIEINGSVVNEIYEGK